MAEGDYIIYRDGLSADRFTGDPVSLQAEFQELEHVGAGSSLSGIGAFAGGGRIL